MNQLDELPGAHCLEILKRHEVGRVALCTSMGPRIIPVNYRVLHDAIIIRTTPYSELGTYGRDREIAFEVDEIEPDERSGCSAVVRGRASMVEDYDELRGIEDFADPSTGADGHRDLYLRVPLREISGRRIAA